MMTAVVVTAVHAIRLEGVLTLLPVTVFATFAGQCGGGGGRKNAPRHISSSRAHSNSNGYTYFFGVKLSNGGTSDFVGRRCALEIQDGSQITGSTNNFAGFTDTHVVP